MAVLTLKVSTGKSISNPDDAAIALAINSIKGDPDGFAILSRNDLTYLQTASFKSQTYSLEYQEGSPDQHFGSTRRNFSADEVVRVFIGYRDGAIRWSDYGSWSKVTF